MKPEMLETLLLDRALSELSPEVSALLDAHLAQNSAAARRAAEISATLQLARAAVVARVAAPSRALDLARLQREHRGIHSTARRTEIFRLAACLALGLVLGWLARPSRDVVKRAPAVAALAPARATDPATQFWSVAHFAREAAELQPQNKR
jgi:hypothetical protein